MRNPTLAAASVAIAFTVVIAVGFWSHQTPNRISDQVYGVLSGIAIPAIAFAAYFLLKPRERRPAPVIFAPPPPRIPNPGPPCIHLEPIPEAMRSAGLTVEPAAHYASRLTANCRIEEQSFKRHYDIPGIEYVERYYPERHERDNPHAYIYCGHCFPDRDRSCIDVVHPDQATALTPWFPAQPEPPIQN